MLANINECIKNGVIILPTDLDTSDYIQPNAVDFTCDRLFKIDKGSNKQFKICNEHKSHCDFVEVFPDEDGYFLIEPNVVYDVLSNFAVNLTAGLCADTIIRSTLSRNGIRISSGLYDTGYAGSIGCGMINHAPHAALIKQGTRIGQLKVSKSESEGYYEGKYGGRGPWMETIE